MASFKIKTPMVEHSLYLRALEAGPYASREFCQTLPPSIRRRSSVCCEYNPEEGCEVHGERCGYVKIVQANTYSEAEQLAREHLGSSGTCGGLRRQMRRGQRTTQRLDRRDNRADQRLGERLAKFDFRQLKRAGRMENREDRQDTREDRQEGRAERREEGGGLGGVLGSVGGFIGGIFGAQGTKAAKQALPYVAVAALAVGSIYIATKGK